MPFGVRTTLRSHAAPALSGTAFALLTLVLLHAARRAFRRRECGAATPSL